MRRWTLADWLVIACLIGLTVGLCILFPAAMLWLAQHPEFHP